jgi:hypothetical protein
MSLKLNRERSLIKGSHSGLVVGDVSATAATSEE